MLILYHYFVNIGNYYFYFSYEKHLKNEIKIRRLYRWKYDIKLKFSHSKGVYSVNFFF